MLSPRQEQALLNLLDRRRLTTASLGGTRRTAPLARLGLIVRTDDFEGPVQADHLWRLTTLGAWLAKILDKRQD